MNNYKNTDQTKSPVVIKGDMFSEYLNCNSFQNTLLNQDFAKPDTETFDKFFNNDDNNSLKSLNSSNEFNKQNINKLALSDFQINDQYQLNNLNFINGGQCKNINEENIKNEINDYKEVNKDNAKKKNLFNTFQRNENEITDEDIKQKKLLMNRQSAKKSRLKKKNYIENLEKQFILLKEEYIRIFENNKIKQSDSLIANNNNNINNQINKILIENKNKNDTIVKLNKCNRKKNSNYKLRNEESNVNNNSNNMNDQKRLLSSLLINQIDIMTPIKIKAFQNKFLKMQSLDEDDSIDVIKNKINTNLNIIIELYGIENENNIPNINICNKKKSMAYKLYDFYKDINILVNKFENIYNNIGNI